MKKHLKNVENTSIKTKHFLGCSRLKTFSEIVTRFIVTFPFVYPFKRVHVPALHRPLQNEYQLILIIKDSITYVYTKQVIKHDNNPSICCYIKDTSLVPQPAYEFHIEIVV